MRLEDVVWSFYEELCRAGLKPVGHTPIPDGKRHRFTVEGDDSGSNNGWYILHPDPPANAVYGCWKRHNGESLRWRPEQARISEEERSRISQAARERAAREQAELARIHGEAAAKARWIWDHREPAPADFPYLVAKGIPAAGLYCYKGSLVVPLKDPSGEVQTLQFIAPDGDKKLLGGGKKDGHYATIGGGRPGPIVICEGVATGISLHLATKYPIAIAMDAGNLQPVARALKAKYPEREFIIAADNDHKGEKNTGVAFGTEAARAIGARLAVSRGSGTDFNDQAAEFGLDSVLESIAMAEVPEEQDLQQIAPEPEPVEDTRPPADESDAWPFRPLGLSRDGRYHYLKSEINFIVSLTPEQHKTANFIHLAPYEWFHENFGTESVTSTGEVQKKFSPTIAADRMIRACARRGVFNPGNLRGRGIWIDDGRVVAHLGTFLIVDGVKTELRTFETRYTYEQGPEIEIDTTRPADAAEASRVYEAMRLLPWSATSARLASGWLVCAMISGALDWRPHIWVTGSKGSGKTWIVEKLLYALLQKNALFVASNSTEAGVRQTLGSDSLPVLFDEAEGTNDRVADQIQRVLSLARQASRDTAAVISKGTPSGRSMQFMIRSAFCMSSIKAVLEQEADRSRFCVLEVDQSRFPNDFRAVEEAVLELWRPGYSDRLFARALRLARVIRANALTFALAAAEHLKDRRAGDQYGALLAGNLALVSDQEITLEQARTWLSGEDWVGSVREEVKGMSDEDRCLELILNSSVRVEGGETLTVGMLIEIARGRPIEGSGLNLFQAQKALRVIGIVAHADSIVVAKEHPELRARLRDTLYGSNWSDILRRIPGAKVTQKQSFGGREAQSRGVQVPLS